MELLFQIRNWSTATNCEAAYECNLSADVTKTRVFGRRGRTWLAALFDINKAIIGSLEPLNFLWGI